MGRTVLAVAISTSLLAIALGCGTRKEPSAPPVSPGPASATSEIPALHPITSSELPVYAGSQRCITCHPHEATQLQSRHAKTLASINDPAVRAPFRAPNSVLDRRRSLSYRAGREGGRPQVTASQAGQTFTAEPAWAFGSGNRCYTYFGPYADRTVELRVSYYRRAGKWDFTPGQQTDHPRVHPLTTPLGRAVEDGGEECFGCHTTALVKEYGQIRPEQSVPGVQCEGCHGPGRDHIAAVERKETALRMPRLTGQGETVMTHVCGKCHRGREDGDPHDSETQGQLPRLQGFALALSACYKKSAGRLTCVTCHDPHANADQTPRVKYNATCAGCHSPTDSAQKDCPVQPSGDCVSCHMPSQAVRMPTRPEFRTHWIKVWKAQGK